MRTVEMTMVNGNETSKLKIIIDYNSKESLIHEADGTIVINLANTRVPFACPEEIFITEAVNKHINIIKDFIIEGLTNCYVEYDNRGREILISKSNK